MKRVGLVVHPRRDIEVALHAIREWVAAHDMGLGQVQISGQVRTVADPLEVGSCDLVLALGGDGTTLAALHAAAPAGRPVLGVACGSIGVLTSVPATELERALDAVVAGDWTPRPLPGLEVDAGGESRVAINDYAVIRDGTGQVITSITVDGDLYARTAGDGVLVSSALGSTGYSMAAGGPILAAGAEGMVVTPLADHGGVAPPLVLGPDSRLTLEVEAGFGGCRAELDGQEVGSAPEQVSVTVRRDYATLVALAGQEPRLAGLRRRGLIVDAARILIRDARDRSPEGDG